MNVIIAAKGVCKRLCLENVVRRIPVEYKLSSIFDSKYAST
jgi:hypothetical protein